MIKKRAVNEKLRDRGETAPRFFRPAAHKTDLSDFFRKDGNNFMRFPIIDRPDDDPFDFFQPYHHSSFVASSMDSVKRTVIISSFTLGFLFIQPLHLF